MKTLHLANIANMAYSYTKLLQQYPESQNENRHEVLCYDLKHILSLPESYENIITSEMTEGEFLKDEYFYSREYLPDWYQRIKTADFFHDLFSGTKKKLLSDAWCRRLMYFSEQYGKNFTLRKDDIKSYRLLADVLSNFFIEKYDIIFGYAYAPVPLLLNARIPYVPVEIGTMREIPFTDTSLGRLLALSYRTAPHVLITNPDAISALKDLRVERYSFIPHPVDEDEWKPSLHKTREFHTKYNSPFIMIAPARQNWTIKGNDKYLHAMAKLVQDGFDFKLIIPFWGQDKEKTQNLITRLALETHVILIDPISEIELREYYKEVDLVLDQFGEHRTFGLIAPKALACGAPVVISFNEELHQWCFPQMPPFISAHSVDEIYQSIKACLQNPSRLLELSINGRKWVELYHSKKRIKDQFDLVSKEVLSKNSISERIFYSLRQKRIEITRIEKLFDILGVNVARKAPHFFKRILKKILRTFSILK